jgi:[protein-PII] uridylyltransferase
LLRRLHELRVLEKLVPGFDHARCLLQFNEYHKYTVDEHSIRAVEQATGFASHPGLLGHVYRQINPKSTLHLALLIHDIGKGYPEDHSEVGRRIAERVAQYLRLADRESERLAFLVHRHLILNHLAFRRDNSDPSLILEAAAEIGSPANLRMLFVLTCADLAAVGPGVLNQWKLEVLSDLYRRIMDHLSGGTPVSDFEQLVVPERGQLLLASQGREQADWFARQINALPPAYLNGPSVEFILEDLDRLRGLGKSDAVAWGRYLPNRDIIEYSVGAHENIAEGIFHRLTGALTSQGLQILSAEIHSRAVSLILDRF